MPATKKPGLSFTLSPDGLSGRLRADGLRESQILALGREWLAREGNVMARLDVLARALDGVPSREELDAHVQAVEACTDDDTHMPVALPDAVRMLGELTRVVTRLARFNPRAVEGVVGEARTALEALALGDTHMPRATTDRATAKAVTVR